MNVLFAGLFARLINCFCKVKPKHWVFGSDVGNLYREGPKYLFEYMCDNHKDYTCTFITRNPKTCAEIKAKGYPAIMNCSWEGIKAICQADSVFTSQVTSDIFFGYKKTGRKHYYLNHGQSLKKQMKALGTTYYDNKRMQGLNLWQVLLKRFKLKWYKHFFVDTNMFDSEFVSVTSDFFIPFMKLSYGEDMPIKLLGMPRNDSLFRHESMKEERWIDGLDGKFVITYMPTHRKYGKGELTPIPFIENEEFQQWMRNNNVVFLMKQHPNMAKKLKNLPQNDVIKEITNCGIDSQVIIYHSDILISDYSSVWLDYLLLKRPLITYIYDDFEKEDAGLNIDIINDTPGHLCFNETELGEIIKKIKKDYQNMSPTEDQIRKFHYFIDGNSCERYYNYISSQA